MFLSQLIIPAKYVPVHLIGRKKSKYFYQVEKPASGSISFGPCRQLTSRPRDGLSAIRCKLFSEDPLRRRAS